MIYTLYFSNPGLLAVIRNGNSESAGRVILLVAYLRLRATSASEGNHEAAYGVERCFGHL